MIWASFSYKLFLIKNRVMNEIWLLGGQLLEHKNIANNKKDLLCNFIVQIQLPCYHAHHAHIWFALLCSDFCLNSPLQIFGTNFWNCFVVILPWSYQRFLVDLKFEYFIFLLSDFILVSVLSHNYLKVYEGITCLLLVDLWINFFNAMNETSASATHNRRSSLI